MSFLQPNLFSTYALTESEVKAGSILTELQKQVIHTLRAQIAEQKMLSEGDIKNPADYFIQDAFLKGQLSALTTLLDSSELYTTQGN